MEDDREYVITRFNLLGRSYRDPVTTLAWTTSLQVLGT